MSQVTTALISDRGLKYLDGIGNDLFGNAASVFESSLATDNALWLGMRKDVVMGVLPGEDRVKEMNLECEDYIKEHYVVENSIHINKEILGFIMLMMKFPRFAKKTKMIDLSGRRFEVFWKGDRFCFQVNSNKPVAYFNSGWQPKPPFSVVSINNQWSYSESEVQSFLSFIPYWLEHGRLPTPVGVEETDKRKALN